MSAPYPGHRHSIDYPANAGAPDTTTTNTRGAHIAPSGFATSSLESTSVLYSAPMNRHSPANGLRKADTTYREAFQVEEPEHDFKLKLETPSSGLTPEELLFAGSNAFYADNYPLMQPNPSMPPNYTQNAYGDSSSNITPQSGLISPNNGRSQHPYYPYSEGGGTSYSQSPPSQSDESQAKRARNTAASARFRAKKKEREQELERSANSIRDNVAKLEAKVVQLETENRWLKDLVTGKIKSPDEEREELGKKKGGKQVIDDWESHRHTDGVGTRRSGRKN